MRQIKFTYEGQEYILEYTRDTVVQMENRGLSREELEKHPMSSIPELFYGAFLAHHRYVGQKKTDEILKKMPYKQRLLGTLFEMYLEPINALFSDPEDSEGNVTWETSET